MVWFFVLLFAFVALFVRALWLAGKDPRVKARVEADEQKPVSKHEQAHQEALRQRARAIKAARDKMEAGGGVRAIKLGGEVVPPTTPASTAGSSAGTALTVSAPVSQTSSVDLDEGGMFAALQKLLKPADIAKIPFEDLADSNIEMFITLRYNRKTTEAGQKLMDSLGVAFRHADEVETELSLKDGGTIKGSELRLTGTIGLQSYDGQLNHTEVYQELQKWLHGKIKKGVL